MKELKLKAGTYYVGDPCYAIREEDDWDLFLQSGNTEGIYSYKGRKSFATSTSYGDGLYLGKDKITGIIYDFPVDSGMLGVIPIEVISVAKDEVSGLGYILTFKEDFICSEDEGVFSFHNITIDTSEEEDDVYLDEYEEDEDEEY
jgi:hypothetical protein